MMSGIVEKARREGLRADFEPLPLIFDADPVAECRSMLLADIDPTDLGGRDPDTHGAAVSRPDGFDFGSIRQARHSGARVYLRFAGEQLDAVVHLEGEEIAGRVHAAFDYLRRHCDPAAATGF